MSAAPYSRTRIELDGAVLAPLDDASAAEIAAACAAIDPWARMEYAANVLRGYFLHPDPASHRYAVLAGDRLAGALAVRHPWLKGPYLEFLAILPPHQGGGIGAAILDWMESEASPAARNAWVLASDFNERALAFYQRHGYLPVAPLPDVAADGFTEILLRKRLRPATGQPTANTTRPRT